MTYTKDDIDIEKYKRKMPNHGFGEPGVVPTQLFIYQFAIKNEDGEETQFDFRVMDIEHPAYKQFFEDFDEEDIPEDADWVANQFGGEPRMGTDNYFETLEDVEDKIKEIMIQAMKKAGGL